MAAQFGNWFHYDATGAGGYVNFVADSNARFLKQVLTDPHALAAAPLLNSGDQIGNP